MFCRVIKRTQGGRSSSLVPMTFVHQLSAQGVVLLSLDGTTAGVSRVIQSCKSLDVCSTVTRGDPMGRLRLLERQMCSRIWCVVGAV
jgi:hypothetical protein